MRRVALGIGVLTVAGAVAVPTPANAASGKLIFDQRNGYRVVIENPPAGACYNLSSQAGHTKVGALYNETTRPIKLIMRPNCTDQAGWFNLPPSENTLYAPDESILILE
ncbi:hypothetical protein E1264_04075 [Actinomadura sp. KC216]|uniref:hypothetical protein n=1 Tax=Actinomadura sp. KC216 TaxID=2530370 RepID=UPI00104CCD7A|nr:hypothetical protein [Actinomadura sp. KC216]TDB90793.1 hypothetical protein E1264_04075 [Actinomadura sp. KC216]